MSRAGSWATAGVRGGREPMSVNEGSKGSKVGHAQCGREAGEAVGREQRKREVMGRLFRAMPP